MGVLSSVGKTLPEFWDACINGKSGVEYIKSFDAKDFEVKIAGEVKDFDSSKYVLPAIYRKLDRFAQLGVCAAKMAIDDAELKIDEENASKIGVIIGSGLGGLLFHEEQIINVMLNGGPSKVMASSVPRISPNAVSAYIAIAFQVKGPNYVVSTACSSGANAIGQAMNLVRNGTLDICITGGVEAPITPVTVAAYQTLHALSRRNNPSQKASCPFSKERDGFVIAEGGGILILESLEHAQKRNARIYAELCGYGANCGAYSMVAPQPDGLDAAQAIQSAMEDAGLKADDVDYINAHGTSTVYNDLAETKAIKQVFKKRAYEIPISSTKSMTGHSIGAAGAIEAIVSALTISNQIIHPTINLNVQDPECDLDYVANKSRKQKVETIISNSFGFGSNNVVIIMRRMK